MSHPFEQYTTDLQTIADAWPAVHPATAAPVQEHVRYNALAGAVSDTIKDTNPTTPDQLVSVNARYGQKVLLRYCLMAAHLAKKQDYSLDQLADLLAEPRSFETLGILASHPLPVVSPTEVHYDLKYAEYPIEPDSLNLMNISGGFVDLVGLERVLADKERQERKWGREVTDDMCAAHRGKALQPIYRSLVQICFRDENLFARTFAETR